MGLAIYVPIYRDLKYQRITATVSLVKELLTYDSRLADSCKNLDTSLHLKKEAYQCLSQ